MTKAQRKAHKIGNQKRKARLLKLYHGVKPADRSWIEKPGFIQDGKYTTK